METNQDDIVHLVEKQDNSVEEIIKVGLKVHSEEEAYNLYNQFALSKGFSIRKGNKRRSMTEPIRQREFLCSKSGYHEHEYIGKVKKFNHLETRTGCQAKIRFTIEKGVWVVSYFNDHHNHHLATSQERINLRLGRKILDGHGDVIRSMVAAGIKQTSSYSFLRKEIGFEEELMDCIGLNYVEFSNIENISLYHVTEDGRERIYCVEFDVPNSIVSCSCNMFESLGLLCRHALRVLLMNNIKEIPEKYILRRWTKKAKSLQASDFRASSAHEEKSSCLLRLSELNHIGYNLFDKGSLTPKCTQIVKEKLFEALHLVEKELSTMQEANDSEISKHTSFQDAINDGNGRSSEKLMFDPVCVKTKGSRNSRMKSQFEKNQKKKTKKAMLSQVSKEKEKISNNFYFDQGKQNKSLMHEGSPVVPLPMESQTHDYSSYHQIPMFNSSSNMSYTKLLEENDPSLFKTQVAFLKPTISLKHHQELEENKGRVIIITGTCLAVAFLLFLAGVWFLARVCWSLVTLLPNSSILQMLAKIEYKSCGPSCSSKRRKSKPTKKLIT
ncbi:hypothetical protein GOBAR_AA04903 [Gossypium barbadense]|uniref:Protein FAR1-RELATED SEQUENCE n=1 Tax=Gossypium barbadense TaxID=3634 RepID=A0A2P5YJB3_GOSBA|nr:hypothetical protein GOBAR_AA04903 [Gossypium barbadense]